MTSESRLPESLRVLYDGTDLASKMGVTTLLLTNSDEGWPRMAMLSVGEIYAPTNHELRFALHGRSGTTRALRSSQKALLVVVVDQVAHRIRLRLREVEVGVEPAETPTAYFVAELVEVTQDSASYARLRTGVTYELLDPAATAALWKTKLAALREI